MKRWELTLQPCPQHAPQGFRGYLANRQEAPFKSLMQELTIAFSQCSLKVRASTEARGV